MRLRTRMLRILSLTTTGALLVLVGGIGLAEAADKTDKAGKNKGKAAKPLPAPSGVRMDHAALARYIDKVVTERLKEENVAASPLCSDAEFVRRVYLDVTGHIPTADQA